MVVRVRRTQLLGHVLIAVSALALGPSRVARGQANPYVDTISSVRSLFLQPEDSAERWCKAKDGKWFARGNKDSDDPKRTAFCILEETESTRIRIGLHLDIYEGDILHVSYYWVGGAGDPQALVNAATALYGRPIRARRDEGCNEKMWDAGPAAAAKAAVEIQECADTLYLNVIAFFTEKQATGDEPDSEANERARITEWLNSVPDALNYDPALDQLGASREAFRAWCRRTTGKYTKRPDDQACDFGAQLVTYRRTSKLDEMMIIWKGFPGSGDSLRKLLEVTAEEIGARYRTVAEKHPSVEVKATTRVTRMGDFVATGTIFRNGRVVGAYSVEQRGSKTARATHTMYR